MPHDVTLHKHCLICYCHQQQPYTWPTSPRCSSGGQSASLPTQGPTLGAICGGQIHIGKSFPLVLPCQGNSIRAHLLPILPNLSNWRCC